MTNQEVKKAIRNLHKSKKASEKRADTNMKKMSKLWMKIETLEAEITSLREDTNNASKTYVQLRTELINKMSPAQMMEFENEL